MNGYITISEAVRRFKLTQYTLRKAVKTGKIRFFISKILPKNNFVTMIYVEDLETLSELSPDDFAPIGILSMKYKVHRSTLHYYRTTGAIRWQQRKGLILVHRKDCESLFAQKHGE